MGSTAHYAGTLATYLGRLEDADGCFVEADAMNARLRAPFFLARTRLAWAQMLLRRAAPGDMAVAASKLDSALAIARVHGCSSVQRDAERLLPVT